MDNRSKNVYVYVRIIYLSFFIFSLSFILSSCRKESSGLNVAGGLSISEKDYPNVVHLSNGCTGSIISSNVVLTAAHCTRNDGSAVHSVVIPGTNKYVRAKKVKGNPKYVWPNEVNRDNDKEFSKYDIAIWVFEDEVFKDVKDKLQISEVKPKVNVTGRLVGWGCHVMLQARSAQVKDLACDKRFSTEKRTGTNTISFVADDLSYVKLYSDTTIITSANQEESATGKGVLVTFGDSGGPLLSADQPTKIIGVASYLDTPYTMFCADKSNIKTEEDRKDCTYFGSTYVTPTSSYNMALLEEMVDNYGAVIHGIQIGIGVVEYNGKLKVIYKEESTAFNEKVEEGKVIAKFNGNSYSSGSALKKAWRAIDFYDRSTIKWSFEN